MKQSFVPLYISLIPPFLCSLWSVPANTLQAAAFHSEAISCFKWINRMFVGDRYYLRMEIDTMHALCCTRSKFLIKTSLTWSFHRSMPPHSDNTNNSQSNQHNHGHSHSHGHGRGSVDIPDAHIHPNGAAKICFQCCQGAFHLFCVLRNRTDKILIVVATLNAQCNQQHLAAQLPSIPEVPTTLQGNASFYVYHWCAHTLWPDFIEPTPDSPLNPVISTISLPSSEGFLHHPHPLPLWAGNLLLNQAQAALFLDHPHQGATVLHEQVSIVQQILLQASPQPPTLVGLPILLETTKRKVHPMSVPPSRLRTKNNFASLASKSLIFYDTNDLLIGLHYRHQHSVDATFGVFSFSCETGTSSLVPTLWTFILHSRSMVVTSSRSWLPLKLPSYRASKGQSSSQSASSSKERLEDICEYSCEAFVDAITKFIIVGDQVWLGLLRWYVLDKFFYHSHWTSLKVLTYFKSSCSFNKISRIPIFLIGPQFKTMWRKSVMSI